MLGIAIAATVGVIAGKLCSTARDMNSDGLITRKELAEIEAKSKAFSEYIEYNKTKLKISYDYQIEILNYKKDLVDNLKLLSIKLLEIDDKSPKLQIFSESIFGIREEIKEMNQYLNVDFLETTQIQMTDFHNSTEIGGKTTNYKSDSTLKLPQTSNMKFIK